MVLVLFYERLARQRPAMDTPTLPLRFMIRSWLIGRFLRICLRIQEEEIAAFMAARHVLGACAVSSLVM